MKRPGSGRGTWKEWAPKKIIGSGLCFYERGIRKEKSDLSQARAIVKRLKTTGTRISMTKSARPGHPFLGRPGTVVGLTDRGKTLLIDRGDERVSHMPAPEPSSIRSTADGFEVYYEGKRLAAYEWMETCPKTQP